MTQITPKNNEKRTELSLAEIKQISCAAGSIISDTGWGEVTVTFQNGEVAEIASSVRRKYRAGILNDCISNATEE